MGSFINIKNNTIMKKKFIYISFALCLLSGGNLTAQETRVESSSQEKMEKLEKEKEEIVKKEKQLLKYKVERINSRLQEGQITAEEAEAAKKEAAELHAENIKNKISVLENEAELKDREDQWAQNESGEAETEIFAPKEEKEYYNRYDNRTTTALVVAAGLNNALAEGQSINDSDFQIGGSRFFEIGWAWKTRVFKRTNWLRFRYGVSFQFNGLKPTDNRYFVQDGEETYLTDFNYDLEKSKFRMDNLVVPVHFEVGPSRRTEGTNSLHFSTSRMLKIGFGGYAGVNIGERQKLKYEAEGDNMKEKIKNDYNTNELVYGLSAYLGWGGATLYGKYDLNPIFQEPNQEIYNVSLGLRFDIN